MIDGGDAERRPKASQRLPKFRNIPPTHPDFYEIVETPIPSGILRFFADVPIRRLHPGRTPPVEVLRKVVIQTADRALGRIEQFQARMSDPVQSRRVAESIIKGSKGEKILGTIAAMGVVAAIAGLVEVVRFEARNRKNNTTR